MKKNVIWIIAIICAIALFIGAYFLYESLSKKYSADDIMTTEAGDETTDSVNKSYTAPDFTVYDENGDAHKLSDYFGKPLVLNFWQAGVLPARLRCLTLKKHTRKWMMFNF